MPLPTVLDTRDDGSCFTHDLPAGSCRQRARQKLPRRRDQDVWERQHKKSCRGRAHACRRACLQDMAHMGRYQKVSAAPTQRTRLAYLWHPPCRSSLAGRALFLHLRCDVSACACSAPFLISTARLLVMQTSSVGCLSHPLPRLLAGHHAAMTRSRRPWIGRELWPRAHWTTPNPGDIRDPLLEPLSILTYVKPLAVCSSRIRGSR